MSLRLTAEFPDLGHKSGRPITLFKVAELISQYEGDVTTNITWDDENNGLLDELRNLPAEKIRYLLEDIVMAPNPLLGFRLLHSCGALKVVLPELDVCYGLSQDSRYHSDTVFDHCVKTAMNCTTDAFWALRPLRWAGLLHDLGKASVRKENPDGTVTFHKHEVHSTNIAQGILDRLCFSDRMKEVILHLVSLHMYHYSSEWTDRAVWRFIRKAGFDGYKSALSVDEGGMEDLQHCIHSDILFSLRQADRISRGLQPVTDKQRDFEKRIIEVLLARMPPSD